MSTPNPYESIVRFATFELDFPGRVLRKAGMRLRCQEQPLQVLAALLEKPGVLVTREELRQRVWPEDTFVDFDHALNTAVKKLRSVLNDDADAPRYIETVPRRGYRFIGAIQATIPPLVSTHSLMTTPAPDSTIPAANTARHSLPLRRHVFLVSALVLLFAFAAVYYFTAHRARASATATPRAVMLAVLPFQNMTSDPAQDAFSDGMTEETTTRLARMNSSRFYVIARTSAMKYKGVPKSVDEIARELHADYLLEGSVRREGPHVRIACQLIRASDQSPRWTQEYNFDSGDPLTLETRVAETIAIHLNELIGDPSAPHRHYTEDALDSYLRGLAESSIHTPEGLDRIIAVFDKAVTDDPNCPQPVASLAHVYERGANLGFLQPRPAYAKARAAAERAIQIDPALAESHVYMADAVLTIDYDFKAAQAEIDKALALNSNDPLAHEWNGIFLSIQNKPDLAIQEFQRAVDLDPLDADHKVFFAGALAHMGRFTEAEAQLKVALQLDPASQFAHHSLADLYIQSGRQADAVSELSTLFFLEGQHETADALRSVYHNSGFDPAMRFARKEQLTYLMYLSTHRYVSRLAFARIYVQLGDTEQAIAWLQKSYDARDVDLPCLLVAQEHTFDSVKNDPRVLAILTKIRPPQDQP